jgi:hypothetical protein
LAYDASFGAANKVGELDHYSIAPVLLLFLVVVGLGISGAVFGTSFVDLIVDGLCMIASIAYLLVKAWRREWRRASSLLIAFPICLVSIRVFWAVGIDGSQAAFWLTYPYYATQVETHLSRRFAWGEGAIFLGGGWMNTLVYDPQDSEWKLFGAQRPPTENFFGLGNTRKIMTSSVDSCEMKVLKRLGGHWYFEQEYYGGGFVCQ